MTSHAKDASEILGHTIISRYALNGAVKGVDVYVAGGPGLRPEELVLRSALQAAEGRLAEAEKECGWMRRNAPLAYSQYKNITALTPIGLHPGAGTSGQEELK